jgi:ligand-binding sensor domain-containing protein/two-component sensor histidine kinase
VKYRFLLIVCFLSVIADGYSQQYDFRNFSVKDGVAQSQVYSVLQDSRGYIWMGTYGGGITRYDGWTFETLSEQDGLINNYVYDVAEDKKGDLWIATQGGISQYDGSKFIDHPLKEIGASVKVHEFEFSPSGRLWMATGHGVFYYENGVVTNPLENLHVENLNIRTICVESESVIWFGTAIGLYELRKEVSGRYKLIHHAETSDYMKNTIGSITKDRTGNIWIGTFGDGAYCYDHKRFFRIDHHLELYTRTVLDIYEDKHGILWFSTLKGAVQYDPKTKSFTFLSEKHGLSNNHVRGIIEDNTGTHWLGTSGGGISNYSGRQFTTYTKNSGLAGDFIYAVFRDSKQRLWVGNSTKGASVRTSDGFVNYDKSNGFEDLKVKSFCEDDQGRIYVGTVGKGVYIFENKKFSPIEELKRTTIRGIIKDNDGGIWVATAGNGLFQINWKKSKMIVKNHVRAEGLLDNWLTSLYCDKWNRIWYGTENQGIGVIDKKGDMSLKITIEDGLTSNNVRTLCGDQSGILWVGTRGEGICNFPLYSKSRKIKSISIDEGLTSKNVYLLTIDANNNVIVGTEKGLDYLFLNEQRKIKDIKHFGDPEGFTGVETCMNAVFNDDDGSIWFGTISGLNRYNASQISTNQTAPIVSIYDVKLFYKSISESQYKASIGSWNEITTLSLPFEQNHVTFDFKAINLSQPNKVRYRWKLVGFDEYWSPPSADHSILYSNLNPGSYTFLVKACNENGVWSKPQSLSLIIAKPIWQEWWFIVLLALGVVLLSVFLFIAILRRFRKKSIEAQRKLEMSKQIMELEQKALRLQMNPHFIFNALNSIQSLVGTDNEEEARYYLAKFSRLMRSILDNSRKSVITLQEEVEALENYLMIEKFCNGDRFDYALIVDPLIDASFVQIPPMMIQPFVENAIKHGFKFSESEKEKRGKLDLTFKEVGDIIECTIQDNGIGRNRSAELNQESKETYHESTALHVIEERLELMHGSSEKNPLVVEDLYAEGGSSEGTRVTVKIPIN